MGKLVEEYSSSDSELEWEEDKWSDISEEKRDIETEKISQDLYNLLTQDMTGKRIQLEEDYKITRKAQEEKQEGMVTQLQESLLRLEITLKPVYELSNEETKMKLDSFILSAKRIYEKEKENEMQKNSEKEREKQILNQMKQAKQQQKKTLKKEANQINIILFKIIAQNYLGISKSVGVRYFGKAALQNQKAEEQEGTKKQQN
ncbi:hypothetical protein TTHERM_00279660 (macronuclear) [Tetrahymena thermophila SB210]|uniref:Uncharacterized protein n=1 Tax=Tetrahymena thermophila (strain SB210) TaxID=312017 RepID=I7M1V9_TETTS|nr:hypothetical protein TTHERM_00279660 [Tetrahymena thermophila SB210]EAR97881.1 hypothetical protein TTHERM_00279660 [Tetrahymena thermophila SB210]|eukprot:XP_001018126.1 hypothetical protein TTHERM_00279660 [Tetrahymena thermophila SB210]